MKSPVSWGISPVAVNSTGRSSAISTDPTTASGLSSCSSARTSRASYHHEENLHLSPRRDSRHGSSVPLVGMKETKRHAAQVAASSPSSSYTPLLVRSDMGFTSQGSSQTTSQSDPFASSPQSRILNGGTRRLPSHSSPHRRRLCSSSTATPSPADVARALAPLTPAERAETRGFDLIADELRNGNTLRLTCNLAPLVAEVVHGTQPFVEWVAAPRAPLALPPLPEPPVQEPTALPPGMSPESHNANGRGRATHSNTFRSGFSWSPLHIWRDRPSLVRRSG